jgi:hypothetical protein
MTKIAIAAAASTAAALGLYVAAQVTVMIAIVNGEGMEEIEP